MKRRRIISLVLAVLLTGVSVFTAYLMADKMAKKNNSAVESITASQLAVTESLGERTLLVENNEFDYHFYLQGGNVILVHGAMEHTFDNWSQYIEYEAPTLVVRDLDGDGEKELLLRLVSYVFEDQLFHSVYVLSPAVDEDGKEIFKVTALTSDTISDVFDSRIVVQITQDPKCEKNGIVAMAVKGTPISYDRETGMPDSYYNMFKAVQDAQGNYLRVDRWEKGKIECEFDTKNEIYITMPIVISYKNSTIKQNAGFMKFRVWVTKENYCAITEKSVSFKANKEYGVYSYKYDGNPWASTLNNSNSTVPRDKTIDFIQATISLNSQVQTQSFANNNSDLNMISKIHANEEYIELTAKKGCSFSQKIIDAQLYSLPCKHEGDTEENDYDISYTASVYKNSDGNEVLKIKFDKQYNQEYMKSLTINFGVK